MPRAKIPAVTQVIGAMVAAKKPFTPELLSDLRLRCLSGARAARAMDTLGTGMTQAIDSVLVKLEAAGRHAEAYTSTLCPPPAASWMPASRPPTCASWWKI